ncbi:acyltransferase family protein [Williamsia herbipolensis]|uniref:acyltransferase family protein n=1 Tax=Williamsia herbipolensis TaxID=1603258 RepID=UPI0006965772|nr:acyltransferase family protein [Williamsia herbipolensis]
MPNPLRRAPAHQPAESLPTASRRSDLDGLRGVSILLVACFHIWMGRVSGGVDVFLTLSGYFFVGSVYRQVLDNQAPTVRLRDAVNPLPRLQRLARRLAPSLVVVLLAVVIGAVVLLPQTRWRSIGSEVIASALYYQNWYLAFNSQDYTAASSANSPLQHVWSMAVQGQFYVLTLVAALLIGVLVKLSLPRAASDRLRALRLRIVAGAVIAGVALISLYWAAMRTSVDQPFNYYDTVARVWEPLAGGLLALFTPTIASRRLRNVLGVAALALIVSSGWWIVGLDAYPGPWALVPVGATLTLICCGHRAAPAPASRSTQPAVSVLLASQLPVELGKLAYTLYLWHWPVLIFYLAYRQQARVGLVGGLIVLSVSLALAWLTYRYIEIPLRHKTTRDAASVDRLQDTAPKDRIRHGCELPAPTTTRIPPPTKTRQRLAYTRGMTAVLVVGVVLSGTAITVWDRHVAGLTVDTSSLDPESYPGARALLDGAPVPPLDPQPSPLEVVKDFPVTSTQGYISGFDDPSVRVGIYGDRSATRTIALAGGSHAEFWITALDALGKQNRFRVTTYLKMGCPLSTESRPTRDDGAPYPQCFEWVKAAMKQIVADRPDAVFTTTTRPRTNAPGDWVPPTYLPIFARLAAAGIPVLGMRDTVWPRNGRGAIDTPACLAAGRAAAEQCGTARDLALQPVNPTLSILGANTNVLPLDLSDGLCTRKRCPAVVGNIIVYKDWHHLSATFVRSLIPRLWQQMSRAMPALRQ